MPCRPAALGLSLPFALLASLGQEALAADAATPPGRPFQFNGRALYIGGGAGVLPDIREVTQNWSLTLTFPVLDWASIEATTFGFHFEALGSNGHDRVGTVALGIGTGLRFEAPADRFFRPYAAVRLQHIHMLFDPWAMPADHVHRPDMQMDMTSMHRWGVGLGAGADFRLTSRLRAGVEVSAALFSGQGTNLSAQGIGFLGVGF